jgi:hypothetical protein
VRTGRERGRRSGGGGGGGGGGNVARSTTTSTYHIVELDAVLEADVVKFLVGCG